MPEISISNDFAAIVSGTDRRFSTEYMEAAKSAEETTPKGMAQLKNFITAIEDIASKEGVKDSRISSSKGHIQQFSGYENIKTAMGFIKKNLSGIDVLSDLTTIFNALESNSTQYGECYSKNIRIGVLEYESAVYMLVTGLSMIMATNMDVVQNGTSVSIQKKSGTSYGVIGKTAKDLAKQMGSKHHKDYLESLIKATEMNKSGGGEAAKMESVEPFTEGTVVADTVELIDTVITNIGALGRFAKRTFVGVKNSLFGIIPLIRSVMYLRYKKKADTVLALDQQCKFIEQNIEQLQNMKTMDETKKAEVIKRQKAVIEAYRKKSEKLRAQLCDGERESATSAKTDEPKISKTDDDFVLEKAGFRDPNKP